MPEKIFPSFATLFARKFVENTFYRSAKFKAYSRDQAPKKISKILPTSFFEDARIWAIESTPAVVFSVAKKFCFARKIPSQNIANFENLDEKIQYFACGKKVIAFDIFDTIFQRPVLPEQTKDALAKFFWAQIQERKIERNKNISVEKIRKKFLQIELFLAQKNKNSDPKLESILEIWVTLFVREKKIQPKIIAELLEKYIEIEIGVLSLNKNIFSVLEKFSKTHKIIFISDFHRPSKQIFRLLASQKIDHFFAAGYSSCEVGKNKKSGLIFPEVLKKEKIKSNEILMIGDNFFSDFFAAKKKGIESIWVCDKSETKRHFLLAQIQKMAHKNLFWNGAFFWKFFEKNLDQAQKLSRTPEFALGQKMGKILVAFFLFLNENLEKNSQIKSIFGVSREGIFLAKMFEKFVAKNPKLPPVFPLGCSRRSTFFAAQKNTDLHLLACLFFQYPAQSFSQICTNLNLDFRAFSPLFRSLNFDPHRPILNPFFDFDFLHFWHHPKIQKKLQVFQKNNRKNLLKFLEKSKFRFDQKIAILDVGWKGSIQENLFWCRENAGSLAPIFGFYLGYLDSPNQTKNPKNQKNGFFFQCEPAHLAEINFLATSSIWEIALSDAAPSVLKYDQKGTPVAQKNIFESILFWETTAEIQAGIAHSVETFLERGGLDFFSAENVRSFALAKSRELHFYPSKIEAQVGGKFFHFENFGVHGRADGRGNRSVWKIFATRNPASWKREIASALHANIWPAAYLRRQKIWGINFFFDWIFCRNFLKK